MKFGSHQATAIYNDLLARSRGHSHLVDRVTDVVERSLLYVLDDRKNFAQLEGCEKSVFGVKFEKRLLGAFDLPQKRDGSQLRLDTQIGGVDVDIKTTLGGRTWMIPPEALGHWCLLLSIDLKHSRYGMGLLEMNPASLTAGQNRDRKFSVSATGIRQIDWLIQSEPFDLEANNLNRVRNICLKNLPISLISTMGATSTTQILSKTTAILSTGSSQRRTPEAAKLSFSVGTGLIIA